MPDARLVAAGSVALTVTLVAIFSLRPLAPRLGLVDRPNERKCHRGRVPLIGGLCFFLGLVAGLGALDVSDSFVASLLATTGLILLTGLMDDMSELSVQSRLAVQASCAALMIAATGVHIDSLGVVLGEYEVRLYALGIPLTIVAVVGLINAFNMMDGIDGLAGGLAVVSILGVLAFAAGGGLESLGVLLLLQLLMVVMVPYLGVNLGWPDGRKIFMGDAGSTVIGFLLAWGVIYLSQREVGRLAPVDVLWCVALPVMDTLGVMVRRIRVGRSPFKPDRQHLHHLVIDAGYSPRAALALILGAGALLAMAGLALRDVPDLLNLTIFGGVLALYITQLPLALRWLRSLRSDTPVSADAVVAAFGTEPVIAFDPTASFLPAQERSGRSSRVRTLCVLGESHDAIRIGPVARQLCQDPRFDTHVCVTDLAWEKQRRILDLFDLKPDIDLGIGAPNGDPSDIAAATLDGMKRVLGRLKPDVVLVHGDTSATLAATLAACYQQIPVARLEAAAETMHMPALSSGEQVNRRVASALATLHFTPSETTGQELVEAGIPRERIRITGDTAVETLRAAIERIGSDEALKDALAHRFAFLRPGSPLLLVTHREQISGFAELGRALRKVARRRPDVDIVYPIAMSAGAHRATQLLGWRPPNVHLVEPLDYLAFAWLLQRAYLVLTGSGEVENEAALFSKPVLVLRDSESDAARSDPHLLAIDEAAIEAGVMTLLSDRGAYEAMRTGHVEGEANAASYRIVDALAAVPSRSSALAA